MAVYTYPLVMPNLLSPPTGGMIQSSFSLLRKTAVTTSAYQGITLAQPFLPNALWQLSFSLRPMIADEARIWQAWLLKLRGRSGTFYARDPDYITGYTFYANNTALAASYRLSQAAYVGQSTIYVTTNLSGNNFPANTVIFEVGDYLQVGSTLHQVVNAAENTSGSASNGPITVDIEPGLKANAASSAVVYVGADARGIFRLDSDDFGWSSNSNRIYNLSFSATESA